MKTINLTDREIALLVAALGARRDAFMQTPPDGGCLPTLELAAFINELAELQSDLREALNPTEGRGSK